MRRSGKTISDSTVQRLKPKPKWYAVWDALVPGFGLVVTPNGIKSWVIQFDRKGKKIAATLGSWPAWDAAKARQWAEDLRRLHDQGKDVRSYLMEQREGKDLAVLADLWRDEYKAKLKPTSQKSYESILTATVLPRLGDRLVKDINYTDIHKFYNTVRKQTPVRANRSIAVLSKLFSIAEKEGWRSPGTNPCRQIELAPEKPKDRILDAAELHNLECTLVRLVETGFCVDKEKKKFQKMDPLVADLVRLVAVSGLRRQEALRLQWTDIDEGRNEMRFEDHKGDDKGAKTLPLNGPIREILKARAQVKLSKYVFPGLDPDSAFQGEGKWLSRIQKESGLSAFTLHDLRRTFNSTCAQLGFPPQTFDLLLGHRLGGVRDTYTVMGAGTGLLATASEDTAQWIQAALHGKNPKVGTKISKENKKRA